MKRLMYPGSFDPITNGHADVIRRASGIADEVLVAVLQNKEKKPFFSLQERVELIREVIAEFPNVRVVTFEGLLVRAVEMFEADAVIRGIRSASDFEYETQMSLVNKRLNPHCETLFLMSSPEYSFFSSRSVREIASYGGDITSFVPPSVVNAIRRRMPEHGKSLG